MKMERRIKYSGAAFLAGVMLISGCSLDTEKTTEMSQATLQETTTVNETGAIEGFEYTILKPDEYGPDLCRGWYIRDEADEKYILICDGWKSSGGYGIHVTNVGYESDTVVISVVATRDTSVETDTILYPVCSVGFNKIPDKVKVVYDDDSELEFGGRIIDTDEWSVDVAIDDDYMAVFSNIDGGRKTYVYKNEDNTYRYINVLTRSNNNVYVKGCGTAPTIYYIDYVSLRFESYEYVVVKGDENTRLDIEGYIKLFGD